jgi:signal transduction histidine kinase
MHHIPHADLCSRLCLLLDKINKGQHIQEQSLSMMTFIVQGMLDYAQMRNGKFRKNLEAFDVREMVEKVMIIQQKQAEEMKVELFAQFLNISENQEDDQLQYSPKIICDQKRIM